VKNAPNARRTRDRDRTSRWLAISGKALPARDGGAPARYVVFDAVPTHHTQVDGEDLIDRRVPEELIQELLQGIAAGSFPDAEGNVTVLCLHERVKVKV
jgi:hypothetical protein